MPTPLPPSRSLSCKGKDRMPCVIQKFGGACFADTERLFAVARQLLSCGPQPVVAVLSAPQGVTDHLLRQMHAVRGTTASPAMDVLLATGEPLLRYNSATTPGARASRRCASVRRTHTVQGENAMPL